MEFYFILTEPQMGENIGAAARVMSNFGFHKLRVVNPRDGWPNPVAEYMSTCGKFILDQAELYQDLDKAVADLDAVYALSGRGALINKGTISITELTSDIAGHTDYKLHKVGLMFGCERTGLSNMQLSLCNKIINIPTDEKNSSMNLAQALAVTCYELSRDGLSVSVVDKLEKRQQIATNGELNFMTNRLVEYLKITNFFQEENKIANMSINISNMFNRHQYSSQEIRTLNGIFRSLFEHKE